MVIEKNAQMQGILNRKIILPEQKWYKIGKNNNNF